MEDIVVVLSGGMDSATLLAHTIDKGRDPWALSVRYGQRHVRELRAAAELCQHYAVRHTVVDLGGLRDVMKNSSQTDPTVAVPLGHYEEPSMKRTVVPNRNMILLAVATAHAISHGIEAVAYGAHSGDHAIYPDCRPGFVHAMRPAMAVCDYQPIDLLTPFIDMDKGGIAQLGTALGVPYELTWTCYQGRELACGKCGACTERLEAFAAAGVTDPVEYEAAA